MKKYYIGILVLMLLAAGLVGYTLYQGSLAKKDNALDVRAQAIAEKLNDYVVDQGRIPASLRTAGVPSIPKEIKYTKLSEEKYKFCVTYQSSKRGYSVGATELALAALYAGSPNGGPFGGSDYEGTFLSINTYSHTKGENCTTVKPYLNSFNDTSNGSTLQTDSAVLCELAGSDQQLRDLYCDDSSDMLDVQEN
jgi:hypothetical protein